MHNRHFPKVASYLIIIYVKHCMVNSTFMARELIEMDILESYPGRLINLKIILYEPYEAH